MLRESRVPDAVQREAGGWHDRPPHPAASHSLGVDRPPPGEGETAATSRSQSLAMNSRLSPSPGGEGRRAASARERRDGVG